VGRPKYKIKKQIERLLNIIILACQTKWFYVTSQPEMPLLFKLSTAYSIFFSWKMVPQNIFGKNFDGLSSFRTEAAENAYWDLANVWFGKYKDSQINDDDICLLFSLLYILCAGRSANTHLL
jgi:hypothetical protein